MKLIGTIDKHDVESNSFVRGGRHYPIAGCMGRLLPIDVGKRVFYDGEIVQVESTEVKNARDFADAVGSWAFLSDEERDDWSWRAQGCSTIGDLYDEANGDDDDTDTLDRLMMRLGRKLYMKERGL
ncbi:MAG: hypothetical protein IPH08_04085 [Rhodocyclaceae bacterium]|nr:hypothetical protein [Rhodocyclaceae bacterium]